MNPMVFVKYPLETILIFILAILTIPFLIISIVFLIIVSFLYFFIKKLFLRININLEKNE